MAWYPIWWQALYFLLYKTTSRRNALCLRMQSFLRYKENIFKYKILLQAKHFLILWTVVIFKTKTLKRLCMFILNIYETVCPPWLYTSYVLVPFFPCIITCVCVCFQLTVKMVISPFWIANVHPRSK